MAALFTGARKWEQCTGRRNLSRWIEKQSMVYTDHGIVFSLKEEGHPSVCSNADELCGHGTNGRSQSQRDRVGFHSREVPKGVKLTGTESSIVTTRGWGRGVESLFLMRAEFQFGKLRKFWKQMVGRVVQQSHGLGVPEPGT